MLFLGKHSKPLDETEMDMFFITLKIYLYTVKVAKRSGEQNRDCSWRKVCIYLSVSVYSNVRTCVLFVFNLCDACSFTESFFCRRFVVCNCIEGPIYQIDFVFKFIAQNIRHSSTISYDSNFLGMVCCFKWLHICHTKLD